MAAAADLVIFNRLGPSFLVLFVGVVDSEVAVLDPTRKIYVLVSWFVVDAMHTQVIALIRVEFLVKLFTYL